MMNKQQGYTLIESVVIIVIVAIMSISAFVFVGFYKNLRIDAASTKLASDIRYAQSRAMSAATWTGVIVYANPTNSYSLYTTNGTTDSIFIDPGNRSRDYTILMQNDFDAYITSVNFDGGSKLEFNPLGQPYIDKTGAALASDGLVLLTSGAYTRLIRVKPNTGKVSIE